MNFPKFSESKGILKIKRSEVCIQGGGAEGRTLKSRLPVYIYIAYTATVVACWAHCCCKLHSCGFIVVVGFIVVGFIVVAGFIVVGFIVVGLIVFGFIVVGSGGVVVGDW